MSDREEVTSQEAAKLLGMAHPVFNQLLEDGGFTFRTLDSTRYVFLHEVMKYKQSTRAARESALNELVQLGQDMEMGY